MLDFIVLKKSSTSFAIGIKSIFVLPHVGHAISVGRLSYKLQSFKICFATFISSVGDAESETLNVSPIPFFSNIPSPILDAIVPLNDVPACVIPKCKGYLKLFAASSYVSIHWSKFDAFSEIHIS